MAAWSPAAPTPLTAISLALRGVFDLLLVDGVPAADRDLADLVGGGQVGLELDQRAAIGRAGRSSGGRSATGRSAARGSSACPFCPLLDEQVVADPARRSIRKMMSYWLSWRGSCSCGLVAAGRCVDLDCRAAEPICCAISLSVMSLVGVRFLLACGSLCSTLRPLIGERRAAARRERRAAAR